MYPLGCKKFTSKERDSVVGFESAGKTQPLTAIALRTPNARPNGGN